MADRPGVFLAGDWVGAEGMLADTSAATGARAARLAIARAGRDADHPARRPAHV
jgi:thioredoxin reductase